MKNLFLPRFYAKFAYHILHRFFNFHIYRMAFPQARLCSLVLVVSALLPLTDAGGVVCMNMQYAGPVKEVIEAKPTKLADATLKAAGEGIKFVRDLVSVAGIATIPTVGRALSVMFKYVVSAFGFGDGALSPEDVYSSLKEEIAQLRQYMDQEIEDLKIDQIRKAFGTDRGGMLSYAEHCKNTYKDDADDMATCLENLRSMLIQQYHFFLPENERASSYEQSLPLFRMYGQLYVDTLLDQIHVAKKRGKDGQAVAHAKALIARVEEFNSHAENSVMKILVAQLKTYIMPKEGNPTCAPLGRGTAKMCVCTIAIGPSKFDKVDEKGQPTDKTKNYCIGFSYDGLSCTATINGYKRQYRRDHAKAIVTYWTKQLGDVVDAWEKIAEDLKPMVENHER